MVIFYCLQCIVTCRHNIPKIHLPGFTGLTGVENDFVGSCSVANARFLLSYFLTCLHLFLIDSDQDPLILKDTINICNCKVKVKVNLCLSVIVYYFPITTNLYHVSTTMQMVVVILGAHSHKAMETEGTVFKCKLRRDGYISKIHKKVH